MESFKIETLTEQIWNESKTSKQNSKIPYTLDKV